MDYIQGKVQRNQELRSKALASKVKNYQGRFDKLILKPDFILSDEEREVPGSTNLERESTRQGSTTEFDNALDNNSLDETALGEEDSVQEISAHDKLNKAERVLSPELIKSEEKQLKWNNYMKKYNKRKHKEREERLNYVSINFRKNIKLYKVDDTNKILINFIVFMEERFDPKIADEINANADDIVKYCKLLLHAIVQIV